jgi:branched-chain amino acid transport system substrate-binding protein
MGKACRFFSVGAILFLTAAVLFPASSVMGQENVVIGMIQPMTGSLAVIGQSAKRGHEFAVERINATGGIKSLGGAKLVLLAGDSQGKPEIGMSEAERLIQKGADVLTGCYQSSVTFAATQVAEKHKVPFVMSMAIADKILERGFKYTFRTQYSSSIAANKTIEYIKALGKKYGREAKTVGLIYENTLFGKATADGLKAAAKKAKLKIVADIAYPHKVMDLSSEVAKLKAAKPDVLIPVSYPTDGILLTRTLADMRVNFYAIVGSANSAFTDPAYISSLGRLAEYTYNVVPRYDSTNPEATKIAKAFQEKYGVYFDLTSVYSYVATQVIADVIERAGSIDSNKMLKALQETDITDPSINILPQKGIKYGKVGKMQNQNIYADVVVEQILDGKLYPVYPEKYASKKPVWPVVKWSDR